VRRHLARRPHGDVRRDLRRRARDRGLAAALVLRRRADAGRPLASPEPLLVPVAALCAAPAPAFRDAGLIASRRLMAWWFYLALILRPTGAAFVPVSGPQLLLRVGFLRPRATVYAHALLVDAARSNPGRCSRRAPRARAVHGVGLPFAQARARPASLNDEIGGGAARRHLARRLIAPGVTAATDGARRCAHLRPPARCTRNGYGFHLRTESDGRLRVTDVVSGSPAHAAGVRRGDALRAVDGLPVDRLHETRAARPGDAVRLDLVAPDGTVQAT
jgi:hypothetical protein